MSILPNKGSSLKYARLITQAVFVILSLWIGAEFYLFVQYLESGGTVAFVERPAGVDAFLPISALLSVIYFFKTGEVHQVHPAGFFLFVSFVLMSIAITKAFCSWICVFGTLSEQLGNIGERLFKRRIVMTKYIDIPLRSIKYLILASMLFGFAIGMSTEAIKAFLDGNYNIVCDIRMYDLFANVTQTTLIVCFCLTLLSIVFRGFWCRYLCPMGALMNLAGFISLAKIHRKEDTCINCSKCTKVCPSFIKVEDLSVVHSDECSSCMNCVDVCPVKNTLEIKPIGTSKTITKRTVLLIVVSIFLACTLVAKLSGQWQNKISKQTYLELFEGRSGLKHH